MLLLKFIIFRNLQEIAEITDSPKPMYVGDISIDVETMRCRSVTNVCSTSSPDFNIGLLKFQDLADYPKGHS